MQKVGNRTSGTVIARLCWLTGPESAIRYIVLGFDPANHVRIQTLYTNQLEARAWHRVLGAYSSASHTLHERRFVPSHDDVIDGLEYTIINVFSKEKRFEDTELTLSKIPAYGKWASAHFWMWHTYRDAPAGGVDLVTSESSIFCNFAYQMILKRDKRSP